MLLPLALSVLPVASASFGWGIRSFNESVGGRLEVNEPFAKPCFSLYNGKRVERDEAQCEERKAHYRSPDYRSQFSGGYMYDQSSICASDISSQSKCLLDLNNLNNTEAYEGVDCRQGNLPSYYLDVQGAQDVVKAFDHARQFGIRLSIKNSGHSFIEDSTGKGTVALWTANMKDLSHHHDFVPEGCSSTEDKFHAITTGAGVTCGEAFKYADAEKATIICGYASTVGLSGGWVQMGGHSVLSNMYGLGADRVLQYTVVTPDGKMRVANKCQNQDLFWALRGGGGGTFGVVIDSTHLVEDAMPIAVASIGFPSKDKDLVYDFMDLLFDTAIDLAEDGWGGHIYGNSIVYVSPKMKSVAEATKSMDKIKQFSEAHGGAANITIAPTWYSFFSKYVLTGSFSVGDESFTNTRLVPTKVHTDPTLRAQFKKYMREFINEVGTPYVPVDSPYLYKNSPGDTSVHPAWYSSLWDWGYPSKWQWNSTFSDRFAVAKVMMEKNAQMEELTPGGGTYKNEASPFTKNWQSTFWGPHYARLLKIKHKYDPRHVLKCFKCVGWTDIDTVLSCYRAFKVLEF